MNLGGSLTAGLTRIEVGGLLSGCGTINGQLVNHGTMLLNCGVGQQLVVNGSFTNHGTLQLLAGTTIAVTGAFVNHGTIDIITSPAGLPPGLIDYGVIINSSSVVIQSLDNSTGDVVITIPTVSNHNYQLQRATTLATPDWIDIGTPEPGTGGVVELIDSPSPIGGQFYYRVLVSP